MKRLLTVTYDVTGLPEHEILALMGEAEVQAESSSDYIEWDGIGPAHPSMGHRDVPLEGSVVTTEGGLSVWDEGEPS